MKNEIYEYLDEIIPNPKCELNYNKDYELLIAVCLSAQTTDKRVNQVTQVLFKKYNSLKKLKEAEISDIESIIRPLGTYKKKAQFVHDIASELNKIGYVPNDRKYLESLNGVGRKTTNVVLCELYKEPYIAVDTHVARVSKRLGLASKDDDVIKIEKKLSKKIQDNLKWKLHHQLLLFGRYYCKAKSPNCNDCKLKKICKNYNK